jgi:hypothetical protein
MTAAFPTGLRSAVRSSLVPAPPSFPRCARERTGPGGAVLRGAGVGGDRGASTPLSATARQPRTPGRSLRARLNNPARRFPIPPAIP